MEINPATTLSPQVASTPTNASNQGGAVGAGDFETFLRMLTVQIQNQDPLNPMEGSDFSVQLATFSGVEQQAKTNKLIEGLIDRMGSQSIGDLSGWIGKNVRTTAPVPFGDQPLVIDLKPHPAAEMVILVTHDQYGREITRESIGPGDGQAEWFGLDALGNRLPRGLYSFTLESYKGDELIDTSGVGAYAKVKEAELSASGPKIIFEGGGSADASEIEAISI